MQTSCKIQLRKSSKPMKKVKDERCQHGCHQMKIFREFKKYADEDRKKSRVEIESDNSFNVGRLENVKKD